MFYTGDENFLIKEFKSIMYEFHMLLRKVNSIFESDISELAKKSDLTFSQFYTLLIIYYEKEVLVSKIARLGSWHITTVMTQLNRLSGMELVEIKPASKGKGSVVSLTDLGRNLITRPIECPNLKIKGLMESIGYENTKKSIDLCHKAILHVLGEEQLSEINIHGLKAKKIIIDDNNLI